MSGNGHVTTGMVCSHVTRRGNEVRGVRENIVNFGKG